MPRPLPVVFDYADHRAFLRDSYLARKARDPRFSYGRFARQAGIASRGHLRDILTGRRGLTPAFARGLARALGLGEEEGECFLLLVEAGQARDPRGKAAARDALDRWLGKRSRRDLTPAETRLLHDRPAAALILALTRHAGFQADPRWIGRMLGRGHPAAMIRKDLALLRSMGLVRLSRRRLVWTAAGALRGKAPAGSPLKSRLHRVSAERARREGGHGGSSFALAILTREEARRVHAGLILALQDLLSRGSGVKREGKLCAVTTNVFPMDG